MIALIVGNMIALDSTIILILSLTLHTGFIFANIHIHILPDGRIIYHSHFTKENGTSNKSKTSQHTHTKQEFLHYNLTTVLKSYLTSTIILIFCAILLLIFSKTVFQIFQQLTILSWFCRRAPPSFLSLFTDIN